MNRMAAIAALTAVLLVCAGVWPGPALAEDVGQFEQVINRVDHLKQGQSPVRQAKVPDGVANQDMVRTQEQSRAKLGFIDDTKMTVGPKTELTIEEYMYDAKSNQRRAVTKVYTGVVETVAPHVIPGDQFITRTPTATAGIRD
jgi:hypothetical protein